MLAYCQDLLPQLFPFQPQLPPLVTMLSHTQSLAQAEELGSEKVLSAVRLLSNKQILAGISPLASFLSNASMRIGLSTELSGNEYVLRSLADTREVSV